MLLRPLNDDDAGACVTMATTAKWATDERKWRMLLAVGDGFGLFADGLLIGTVIVNRFGDELAMIAMMVVHADHRRRGVGRQLMDGALAHAGKATVALYATDLGRPLYASMGLVETGTSVRFEGRAEATRIARDGLREMRAGDLEGIARLDAEAQGAPRTRLLEQLTQGAARVLVIERDHAIVGFGVAQLQGGVRILGPIVAPDDDDARALVAELAASAIEPLIVDVPSGERAVLEWARSLGFKEQAPCALMVRDGAALPGARGSIRTLASRAFG